MRRQGLRRDRGDVLSIAEAGDAGGFALAHDPAHAHGGVDALVVLRGLDGVDQVLLFAFDIAGIQQAVFQRGMEQNVAEKLHHRGKDGLASREEGLFNKISVKAGQLRFAAQADERAERCAVQLVKAHRDGAHIRPALRAAQQHTRQQSIKRGGGLRVRAHQVEAKAAGLEFLGLHGQQGNACGQLDRFDHGHSSFFSMFAFIIHVFPGNERAAKRFRLLFRAESCRIGRSNLYLWRDEHGTVA